MFLVGGTLADRLGYKPLIVAGCVLRTVGFATLGLVDSLPALLAASAATGLAGALFNPAVRAYLAADAGERRVEAFALFNVFYQAGILLGPLVGMLLTGVDFRVTCLVSAGDLRPAEHRADPRTARTPGEGRREPEVRRQGGRAVRVARHRRQPAVPAVLHRHDRLVRAVLPGLSRPAVGSTAVGGRGDLRYVRGRAALRRVRTEHHPLPDEADRMVKARMEPGQALAWGLSAMGLAFVPLLIAMAIPVPDGGVGLWLMAALPPTLAALLLALGHDDRLPVRDGHHRAALR